jgi:hypothetical protein
MIGSELSSLGPPVITYPMASTPATSLPQPFPKVLSPTRTETRNQSRGWTLVGRVVFKLLQIGIFLSIVLWPWETAE